MSPLSHHHCPRNLRSLAAKCQQVNEQKQESPEKKFPISVPSIPKLSDIESARRLLESAFQAFSFEMPKFPIESALQGLSFDVSRFTIPKQMLIFNISGFVATKWRKAPTVQDPLLDEETQTGAVFDESRYPRCAWPRRSKGAKLEEPPMATREMEDSRHYNVVMPHVVAGVVDCLQYPDVSTPHLGQTTMVYPHCKWPRQTLQTRKMESLLRPDDMTAPAGLGSMNGMAHSNLSTAHIGPHCAWPRFNHQASGDTNDTRSVSNAPLYPRSAWPRRSTYSDGVISANPDPIPEASPGLEGGAPSIIEGGARCAWPRTVVSSGQNADPQNAPSLSGNGQQEVLESLKPADTRPLPAINDDATALPRRMLATSLGLTLMNQLAKGGFILTSPNDLLGLLPAGPLEIAEENEVATLDVGRRTLILFFKS